MSDLNKHKYEWYLSEKNELIYDDDVVRYLTPRRKEARSVINSIRQLISENETSDNIVVDYLNLGELISMIECILESRIYQE